MRWICITLILLSIFKLHASHDLDSLSLENLLDLEVYAATKEQKKIQDVPASVIIVTKEDIQRYNYTSLEEIIANIPGFFGIDAGMYSGIQFGVRGFWTNQANRNINILVNGVDQGFSVLSAYPFTGILIPVETIQSIEIVRGPMSLLYGSGSFYGIVNIITNEITGRNLAAFSTGDHRTNQLTLRLEDSFANGKSILNAMYYEQAGLTIKYDKMMTDASAGTVYQNRSFNMKKKYIMTEVNTTIDNFELETKFTFSDRNSLGFYPSFDNNAAELKTITSALKYNKDMTKNISISSQLRYNYAENLSTIDYFFLENCWAYQDYFNKTVNFESNLFYKNKNFTAIIGVNDDTILEIENRYDLPSLGGTRLANNFEYIEPHSTMTNHAFYAQANWKINSLISCTAGLRAEYHNAFNIGNFVSYLVDTEDGIVVQQTKESYRIDKSETEIIPQFALLFNPKKESTIKLMYGEALNRPSWFQIMKNATDPNTNTLLKPEKIKTLELNYTGVLYNLGYSVSGFYSQLNNLIMRFSKIDGNGNYRSWMTNGGEYHSFGGEFILQYRTSNFQSELSLTVQETIDKTEGHHEKTIAYSPKILGYSKLSYKITSKVSMNFNSRFVDKMKTAYDEEIQARIGQDSPAYWTADIGFQANHFLIQNLSAKFVIKNIFDQEIIYPNTDSSAWSDIGTPGLPQLASFTLQYNW